MSNKFNSVFFRAFAFAIALTLVLGSAAFGFARAAFAEESPASGAVPADAIENNDIPEVDVEDVVPEDDPADAVTTGEDAVKADASSEEEAEKPKVEFVLFSKLKKLTVKDYILIGAAVLLSAALIVFLVLRRKHSPAQESMQKVSPTLILVHGALCIALSFILSYIKLFKMPFGGSVTLASMLPLMIYANRHGLKWGLLAGLVYGFLQYFQGGWFVHWVQLLLDYPIAFALIGLAGLVRGDDKLILSVLIGGFARFVAAAVSGYVFWYDAGSGLSPLAYTLAYNAYYLIPDIAICAIISVIPPFRKAMRKAFKY